MGEKEMPCFIKINIRKKHMGKWKQYFENCFQPVGISTSSVALQKAILSEYIPFLSKILTKQGIIQTPLNAIVRKGKAHFVCDVRLQQRLEAVKEKMKNAGQKQALLSLRHHYDLEEVHGLSGFDRRLVCARLRHVAGTQWGAKHYMNMDHLAELDIQSEGDNIAG